MSIRNPVALFVACAVAAAGGARADDAGPTKKAADDNSVETVTVTAQFRQENLQETPIAITAITGEMLDARSQKSLSDVTAQAPNVILRPNPAGSGNSMSAYIRGVGQGDFDPAVDPGVGIYVDDVYFATLTGSDFDLLDLDRVEILRGPQGTLSGMNSLGGSVKLYSRKPDGSGGGFIEATGGSLNRTDVRASGNFTLVPDQLYARISGVSRHRDGYVTLLDYACSHPSDPYVVSGAISRQNSTPDCRTGTEGNVALTAVRGALRWVASDKVEANVVVDATRDTSETQANTLLGTSPINAPLAYQGVPYDNRFVPYGPNRGDTVVNNAYVNYANFIDPGVTYTAINPSGAPGKPNGVFVATPAATLSAWGISGTLDWKLADRLSLKSISAFRKYTSHNSSDNDDSPVAILQNEGVFSHNQKSEELRLSGAAFGTLLDYTVGGIYFEQRTVYATREDDPFVPYGTPSQPTFDFIQNDPTEVKTHAFFGNSAWHFTDQLTLNAGIRYTKENKDYTFYRYNPDGVTPYQPLSNPANPLNGKVGTFDGSHTDYRLDLDYQWTPSLMTYAEFSTGFKGGGITPRPYFPQQVIGFGPETLKSYEIGLKSQWFENRVRANFAVFDSYYKDYQAFATATTCVDASGNLLPPPYNNPCGEYRNVADARVKGGEAEFELRPVSGLLIDAAFSYVDFKFTNSKSSSVTVGDTAPGIGKVKWSAGVQYELPLAGRGSLTPRFDVDRTPGYCGNITCDPVVQNDPYVLANARLTYWSPERSWSVAAEVTNLTDKLYYINKFNAGSGYTDGQIGLPREWAVSVRKEF